MQSESGSGGNEYARLAQEWILARAQAKVQKVQGQAWEVAQAEVAQAWEETQTRWEQARKEAQAREEAQAPEAKARKEVQTRKNAQERQEAKWARMEARAREEEEARAQEEWASTLERARGPKTQAAARAEALGRALARNGGMELLKWATRLLVKRLSLTSEAIVPHPHSPTYHEVLADSEVREIISYIDPYTPRQLLGDLWGHSEHFWLIQCLAPVTRLPPELLQSILSTIIDDASISRVVLMLVSKHWCTIVTSISASLKLGTTTPRDTVTRQLERNQLPPDIIFDTEIDRGRFTPSRLPYQGIFAAIEATSRWRSLVIETFPGQADLPEHMVNHGLQRCSNATVSRLETFMVKSACEMSPLLDRLLRILGTTAGPKLTTVEVNSASVISFLVPAYPSIFRSVKVLSLDISGTHGPLDLLPHLHQLEELSASHLSLPIYEHDIKLPFVNTLRHLRLTAVSIQWMSGRNFPLLESCIIRSPLHPRIFSTTLPSCEHLTFQGYPLDILDGLSLQKLVHLSVTSSGSFNKRGARQLVWFSSRVLGEMRVAPRILHISIEATSQAWVNALRSMTHLEELVIGSAQPSSLRAKVLQPLIAQPVRAGNTGAKSTPERWRVPWCPSLRRFGLKYHRSLRPSERFDLIPDIVSIILSRKCSNCSLQSFWVLMGSDQKDALELIEQSRISLKGIEHLVEKSGINEQDLWVLVNMRLIEFIFRPPGGYSRSRLAI